MKPLTIAILLIPVVAIAAHLKGMKGIRVGADSGGSVACVSEVTDGESLGGDRQSRRARAVGGLR